MPELKDLIHKHALANAVSHKGKCVAGAVVPKILGTDPELKSDMKKLIGEISKAVEEVNSLSIEKQKEKLQKIWPEFFEKKEVSRELPELPDAKEGKVITRLPPEPNGHLHIGHAISFFFNEYYAKKYKGKLFLRFEDTQPEAEKKEYYDSIMEDLKWLGIEFDERANNSDYMDVYYEKAEELMGKENAYICQCPVDRMRDLRFKGTECGCRKNTPDKNRELWESMKKDMPAGAAALRLKADMKAKNTVMRDPTLFRIIEASHPLTRDKYRVWPLYDFANAIADALCNITHVLRSSEFVQREELQNKIRDLLGMKNPYYISYSRIKVNGSPTSKREIKALIENKTLEGWDDPRLVTLKALKRRGILPETLRELALEVRMTHGSTTIDWKTIHGINRKILDKEANRYFFVPEEFKVTVKHAPLEDVELNMHPDSPDLGTRKINTRGNFFIPKSDANHLGAGEIFRLKDLYNVKVLEKKQKELVCEYAGKDLLENTHKIQWVTDLNIEVDVLIPHILFDNDGKISENSLVTVHGVAEHGVGDLKVGDVVQFERFGFVKIEETGKKVKCILSHK